MAKMTKKQIELLVDFAAAQHRAESWHKLVSLEIRKENPDLGKHVEYYKNGCVAAVTAVSIARSIGMTDAQINECHEDLLFWSNSEVLKAVA